MTNKQEQILLKNMKLWLSEKEHGASRVKQLLQTFRRRKIPIPQAEEKPDEYSFYCKCCGRIRTLVQMVDCKSKIFERRKHEALQSCNRFRFFEALRDIRGQSWNKHVNDFLGQTDVQRVDFCDSDALFYMDHISPHQWDTCLEHIPLGEKLLKTGEKRVQQRLAREWKSYHMKVELRNAGITFLIRIVLEDPRNRNLIFDVNQNGDDNDHVQSRAWIFRHPSKGKSCLGRYVLDSKEKKYQDRMTYLIGTFVEKLWHSAASKVAGRMQNIHPSHLSPLIAQTLVMFGVHQKDSKTLYYEKDNQELTKILSIDAIRSYRNVIPKPVKSTN